MVPRLCTIGIFADPRVQFDNLPDELIERLEDHLAVVNFAKKKKRERMPQCQL